MITLEYFLSKRKRTPEEFLADNSISNPEQLEITVKRMGFDPDSKLFQELICKLQKECAVSEEVVVPQTIKPKKNKSAVNPEVTVVETETV
jgi:hypothetical protein